MRTLLLGLLFTLSLFAASAQTNSEDAPNNDSSIKDSSILNYCQIMPSLKTSEYKSFDDYLAKNLIYPDDAKAARVGGKTYVEFIIEIDGSVSNVKIVKGKELYPSCDQEAIRVVATSPKWQPGMQDGNPRRVKMYKAFMFNLVGGK